MGGRHSGSDLVGVVLLLAVAAAAGRELVDVLPRLVVPIVVLAAVVVVLRLVFFHTRGW